MIEGLEDDGKIAGVVTISNERDINRLPEIRTPIKVVPKSNNVQEMTAGDQKIYEAKLLDADFNENEIPKTEVKGRADYREGDGTTALLDVVGDTREAVAGLIKNVIKPNEPQDVAVEAAPSLANISLGDEKDVSVPNTPAAARGNSQNSLA